MCNLSAAELDDLLRLRRHAFAQTNDCADLLAVLAVGHAHHGHVQHLGMAVEKLLDLARIHILAAADDHVLDAADDVAVALRVDDGEIAAVHPARRIDGLARALGLVPVAAHHAVAAGEEFPGRAARRHATLGVDDLYLHVRVHPTDGRHA